MFELFQDLDRFSLEDYQQFSDTSEGMGELIQFLSAAANEDGKQLSSDGPDLFCLHQRGDSKPELRFTTNRDESIQRADVDLLGLQSSATASRS